MTKIDQQFLSKIDTKAGRCAFRGQENADWKLYSSALRRLQKDPEIQASILEAAFPGIYLNYHRDELIEPARATGFGIEQGNEISDLQLLAKLQHFGAATGLMDFTWNPLIALWFACRESQSAMRSDGRECDGKVFVLNLNNPEAFRQVSHKREDQDIQRVFPEQPDDRSLYWEPMINGEAAARIIGQASVFVIPRPYVQDDFVQEIKVTSADKAVFRSELADFFGITEEYLFRDIHGFSALNSVDSSIRLMKRRDPKIHFYRGNELYQRGKYAAAIRSYSRSIELSPDVRELYFLRANARAESADFAGALEDYTRAGECKRFWLERTDGKSKRDSYQELKLLFNRGNTKAAANDHAGAIADYDDAIQYCRTDFWHTRVVFNRANSMFMLQQLEQALADYEYVLRHGANEPGVPYEQARFNKGNILVVLGKMEDGINCYEAVSKSNTDLVSAALNNLEAANQVLSYVSNSRIERILRTPDASVGLPIRRVEISCSYVEESIKPVPFAGHIGNIGNTGGTGLSGGSGFRGGPGFSVIVSDEMA